MDYIEEKRAPQSIDENNSNEVTEESKPDTNKLVVSEVCETSSKLNVATDCHEKTDKEEVNDKTSIEKQEISPEENSSNSNAATKEPKSDDVATQYDVKNVHYVGDVAVYTDPTSGYQYEWDKEKNEWVPKNSVSYGFEDDTHTYTDADGTKFFWDKDKHAWFPKITDDFMAQYQMNYGFADNPNPTLDVPSEEPKEEQKVELNEQFEEKKGVKRKPSTPTWFEMNDNQNTKVYVSNLPEDYTEEEFVDLMQKCGLVMRDAATGKMKIKLYRDSDGHLKGDALCTYIRIESVDLALKLLDGYDFKNKKIKVERAKFQMKGEYDPKLKPKMKKRKEKQKLKRMQEKLFDWRPEKMIGERSKHERVVIVKNLFESSMFDKDVGLILEFQQDLREECSKCGEVRKVIIYDRHPEGVAQINMSCAEEADECVNLLNGRWFGKRKITAEIWDGKTKFKIAETDAEISQRLDKWDKFLEEDSTTTTTTTTDVT